MPNAFPATDRTLLAATVRIPPHVVRRAFATEIVVLNLQTGMYHGLNATASRMLDALDGEDGVNSVVTDLAEEFDRPVGEIQDDVIGLVRSLHSRGLLEVAPRADDGA